MSRLIIAAFSAVLIATFAVAKPTTPRKPNQIEQKKSLPDLTKLNDSNWGHIEQVGRNFVITGHPQWEAVGEIRADGRISLIWTRLSDQQPCPGVYNVLPNGELDGLWGVGGEVEIDDKGNLVGSVRGDRIYRLPPPVPEI